jgi:hypothetical protein
MRACKGADSPGPAGDPLADEAPATREAPGNQRLTDTGDAGHRPRRWLRRAPVSLGALILVALVVGGGLRYLTNRYGGTIERVGTVFAGLDEGSRPAAPSDATGGGGAPVPFLLVGSDTRGQRVLRLGHT